jgi:hypothetical protein
VSERTPTRRTVIASLVAVLCSGCSSLPIPGSRHDNTFCKYEAIAKPFHPAEELPPDYSSAQRALALRVIRQETVTAVYGPRPLKNDSFVVKDGTFYRVVLADSHTAQLPALVMTVEWESGRQPPDDATLHAFADLPRVDRLALRSAVYGGIYRTHAHPETKLIHSQSPIPYPDGTQSSVLKACDSCWVEWNDRAYHIISHREDTIEKPVYTYSASVFAANAERFRELIVDRYLVRLNDLTPEERAIMDEAVAGRYYKRTDSRLPAFHRLRDRLPEHTVPESGGQWFVEYEGNRYGLDTSMVCQGV